MRVRVWAGLAVALLVAAAAGFGIVRLRRAQASGSLPTAPARQGEFLVMVRCRGDLAARRTIQLTASKVPDLRIVWLAPTGGPVTAGQVVIKFDPSSARQQLDEKNAALKQAQAGLDQATAQARITAEQDKLDLSAARYQVERARLEASKQAIVSEIQGSESKIDLGMAEEKQKVAAAAVNLHQKSDQAKTASLTRQRDKAQDEVDVTNQRLKEMEIRAPQNGIINYVPNYSQGWMNAQPFKVGDHAWPGGAVAEIPDLSTLEIQGKVEEVDRGRIAAGNDVRIHVDALPEKTLTGKLESISPLTEQSFEWPPTRSFRAYAHIDHPEPQLRPGMNGSLDVIVTRIANAISIPAKALFTRKGKPIVYVADAANEPRAVEVRVLGRNPDEIAIEGIRGGALVTLAEPAPETRKP